MSSDTAYRVYLTDEYGERIHVGDLMATGKECAFRYSESFRRSEGRFSIDPINLPIEKTVAREQNILFGVFKDSLPDGWGLTLMAKRFDLPTKEQSPHLLLQYLDRQSIGALSYENITGKKRQSVQEETIKTVGELAEAARLFETGELQDRVMLKRLFNSAGSTGGAHPKANVIGEDGRHKIVKFPSAKDNFDVVGLEASCLELARMTGMRVPDFEVIEAGSRKDLCLNRFDRTDEGCRHMISMKFHRKKLTIFIVTSRDRLTSLPSQ